MLRKVLRLLPHILFEKGVKQTKTKTKANLLNMAK